MEGGVIALFAGIAALGQLGDRLEVSFYGVGEGIGFSAAGHRRLSAPVLGAADGLPPALEGGRGSFGLYHNAAFYKF